MFDDDEDSVNAEVEEVVQPQNDDEKSKVDNSDTGAEPEIADPEQKEKPALDEDAIYARLRRKADEDAKKVYQPLTEAEQDIKDIEELTGMSRKQVVEYLRNQRIDNEAATKAEKDNIPVEVAKELIQQREKIQAIEDKEKQREKLSKYDIQKAELKGKPYFAELEEEIKGIVDNSNGTVDYNIAYKYVLGEKVAAGELDKIKTEEAKKATQRTLANVQDRSKRGVSSGGDGGDFDEVIDPKSILSKDGLEMANIFGVDPKIVAKHVRNQTKK